MGFLYQKIRRLAEKKKQRDASGGRLDLRAVMVNHADVLDASKGLSF